MKTFDGGRAADKLLLLLAEADLTEMLVIRRAAERLPFISRVLVVPDGETAIAYIRGLDKYGDRASFPFPDVLLLDYDRQLGLAGLDALCWIRSEPGFDRIPVAIFDTDFSPGETEMIDRLQAVRCVRSMAVDEMAEALRVGLISAVQKVEPAFSPFGNSTPEERGPKTVAPRRAARREPHASRIRGAFAGHSGVGTGRG